MMALSFLLIMIGLHQTAALRRYFASSTSMNWNDGQAHCTSLGANLAAITSEAENNIARQKCSEKRAKYCWIGGHDKDGDGQWHWIDGTVWDFHKDDKTRWAGEDCMELVSGYDGTGNNWNDKGCGTTRIVLCSEHTDAPTPSPSPAPTPSPSTDPTPAPTYIPTKDPTNDPTADPSIDPTSDPTADPSMDPTFDPTADPTIDPTNDPTVIPTKMPSRRPTNDGAVTPTQKVKEPTAVTEAGLGANDANSSLGNDDMFIMLVVASCAGICLTVCISLIICAKSKKNKAKQEANMNALEKDYDMELTQVQSENPNVIITVAQPTKGTTSNNGENGKNADNEELSEEALIDEGGGHTTNNGLKDDELNVVPEDSSDTENDAMYNDKKKQTVKGDDELLSSDDDDGLALYDKGKNFTAQ